MADFNNRVAIVTGAGRGLGRAYAILLAKLGAKVVVNNRTRSKAIEVVNVIKKFGGDAIVDSSDVGIEAEKTVELCIKHFGRVDILISNAGQLLDRSFKNMTHEEWYNVIQTHLHGTFRLTKAAWPTMIEQNYGRIVLISSMSAVTGNVGQANYSAAKGGITTLANTLAMEGARHNIMCNAIATAGLTRVS